MKSILLFLKWFFLPRGSFKIEPTPTIYEFYRRIGKPVHSLKCSICKETYWSRSKNPSPVCTAWACFHKYYGGDHAPK